jgi:hypothetical protein
MPHLGHVVPVPPRTLCREGRAQSASVRRRGGGSAAAIPPSCVRPRSHSRTRRNPSRHGGRVTQTRPPVVSPSDCQRSSSDALIKNELSAAVGSGVGWLPAITAAMSSVARKRPPTSRRAPLMLQWLISFVVFIPLSPRSARGGFSSPCVPASSIARYPPHGAAQSLERASLGERFWCRGTDAVRMARSSESPRRAGSGRATRWERCSTMRLSMLRYCAMVFGFQRRRTAPSANHVSAYSPNVSGAGLQ